jgi:hypothetical protein
MVLATFVINSLTTTSDGVDRALATIQHPFSNKKVRIKLLHYHLVFEGQPATEFSHSISRIKFTGLDQTDALKQINALNSYLPSTDTSLQYFCATSSGFCIPNSNNNTPDDRCGGYFSNDTQPIVTGYLTGNFLTLEVLATDAKDEDADPSGSDTEHLSQGFLQFDIEVI